MYVCICNAITDTELKKIIDDNKIVSMPELKKMGIADNCSKCWESAREILDERIDERFKNEDWYISPKDNCHWEIKVD